MSSPPVFGIICGGGPAPGVNAVIAAATFSAKRLAWTVYGFHDGYLHLASGDSTQVSKNLIELNQDIVSRSYQSGGSIIRTDRFDPTRSPLKIANVLSMLSFFHVKYLLILGGNDKIACTHLVTQGVDPAEMQVIVVPKTIDNDIALPPGQFTIGYHSAISFAVKLLNNLLRDARSAPRYFIVETMGRLSGHLALAMAEAAGAQLAIIPEDFGDRKIEISDICDIFEGCILKRLTQGKNYGMCVISECLVNQLSSKTVQTLLDGGDVSYGREGQIVLEDAELGRAIAREVNRRFRERVVSVNVTSKKIGYELRSQVPDAFDAELAQELGFAAVEGFRQKHSNCVVVRQQGGMRYVSFRELMDSVTGRITPRKVNVNSQRYTVAREYFTFLTKEDLKNPEFLERIAAVANMNKDAILEHFQHVPELTVK
jgi:6-phosphofructokinase 1